MKVPARYGDSMLTLTTTSIFAGLRIDYHTEAGVAISPRMSIVHSLGSNQSLRLSASQAFKYPSYLQNYIDMNIPFFSHEGNKDLDTERLTSVELAYQMFNPSGLSLTAACFYNNYTDTIDSELSIRDRKFYLTYENLYDMYQYGVELDGSYRYSRNLLVRANYSYVWKQKKDGITFGPVPKNQINGEIRYDFDSGFWIDMRIHWQDDAAYSMGMKPSNLPDNLDIQGAPSYITEDFRNLMSQIMQWHEADGYTLGDISLGYMSPTKKWRVAAAVHNVFHSRYQEIPDSYESDTTFTARLTVDF